MSGPELVRIKKRSALSEAVGKVLEVCETLAPPHRYPACTEISLQGYRNGRIVILESGFVTLRHTLSEGGQSIIALRRAPWMWGTHSLLSHDPQSVSIVAQSPCIVREVSDAAFVDRWRGRADLSWAIHEFHALEFERHLFQEVGLSTQSTRQCLEEMFWQLSAIEPNPTRIEIPLFHEQLAQLLRVSSSQLRAQFCALEQDGIVQREAGWLKIPDRNRLWRRGTFQVGMPPVATWF